MQKENVFGGKNSEVKTIKDVSEEVMVRIADHLTEEERGKILEIVSKVQKRLCGSKAEGVDEFEYEPIKNVSDEEIEAFREALTDEEFKTFEKISRALKSRCVKESEKDR